jgi:hypothetical protein
MARRGAYGLLAFGLLGFAAPVFAQAAPSTIEAKSGQLWKHKASGTVLPAAIVGIARNSVREFGKGEWDVAGIYELPGLTIALTVYIYQPAVQDAAIWFAEARIPIESRSERYGKVNEVAGAKAFIPTGETIPTGLRTVWSGDGAYKSTALATAPVGRDWLMKIRLSSKDKTAPELDVLLTQVLSELRVPKAEIAVAAAPIAPCTTKLKPLMVAKPAQNDGASALVGSLFSNYVMDQIEKPRKGAKAAPPPTPFCRDEALSTPLNVYRRDDASEFYVLSTGDSGRAAIAQRDALGSLLAKTKDAPPAYSVQFVVPGEATVYGNYDRLPPPSQVIEIVNAGKWKSRTARTAKGSNITINPDTMK